MARYVRFIVHQRIEGESRKLGLFAAAYHLRDEEDLVPQDRKRLEELLTWLENELTVPPDDSIPPQAIFWYIDVGPFSQQMWELAQLINEYNFTSEQITSPESIGRVVYADQYQLAAIPPSRRHR